ncbi:MAG: MBL fold metallo-hydrolase [Prochloraceae cyanobacterium]|nr:MBL fold metallo-hydrolase [Prochloraceae cyanobacterium]
MEQKINFYLEGEIVKEDNYYLKCHDGEIFKLKNEPLEIVEGFRVWSVIPTTDSNGQIQSIFLIEEGINERTDLCRLVGRITQLGKKQTTILMKVASPGKKTLKITLVGGHEQIKTGQMWSIEARRKGQILKVIEGQEVVNSIEQETIAFVRFSEREELESLFECYVTGRIELREDCYYLVDDEGVSFPLKKNPEKLQEERGRWRVIPSTSSDGRITNFTVREKELEKEEKDYICCQGKVMQVGAAQKSNIVSLSVEKGFLKPVRITLLGVSPEIEVGQILKVEGVRKGEYFKIEKSQILETGGLKVSELKNESKILEESQLKKARLAIESETSRKNWTFEKAKQRRNYWEWEAISECQSIKARVQIDRWGKTKVYQYRLHSLNGVVESLTSRESLDRCLSVRPLGAARDIGASCFQVKIGPYEVILDCGVRFGENPLPALEYIENPNLLLISHAHQDHLGAVPVFHQRYPGCRMICTPGTREIAQVMLLDGLKIQKFQEDSPQLYDSWDLERALWRLETMEMGRDFEPLPGLTVRFINAGHILGAACIYLKYKKRTLLYTGDFNTTSSRTTTGMKWSDLPRAEMLITESTYGDQLHPSRKTQERELVEGVIETVTQRGNVLIPAFALGRAQEILLALRTNSVFQQLNIPVYVDGLVRGVTEVFQDNLDLLPVVVKNFQTQSQKEPFFALDSTPPVIPIQHRVQRPLALCKPSVIVASSGMLVGGPSVYYARVLLERENAAIFICGYTDEESPGRLLQNLATGERLELDGEEITVAAKVKRFSLSAHADKTGIGQTISQVQPKHLILVHGSMDSLHNLGRSSNYQNHTYVHIPNVGDVIELGVAPKHLSLTQITKVESAKSFILKVDSLDSEKYLLHFPTSVAWDPRLQSWMASGELVGSWSGESLNLLPRKVDNEKKTSLEVKESPQHMEQSHKDNLSKTSASLKKEQVGEVLSSQENLNEELLEDGCKNCQFANQSICTNERSPLFEFVVDPTGICSQFEGLQ